jgi:hypothetical protein
MRVPVLRSWEAAAVVALVLLFVIQACLSALNKSLTIDEYTHFGAGASYVQNNYYRLNPNHPPFVKVITGLAVLPLGSEAPPPPADDARKAQRYYGIRYARLNAGRIERITFAGRLPHIAIAVLLGLGIWITARHLFGRGAALAALLLWATDPNILAHARLVHTDSGAAVFVFLSVAAMLFLVCRRPTWSRCLLFSMFLALALLTKYSTVVLIGIVPLTAALYAYGFRRGYIVEDGVSAWPRERGLLGGMLLRVLLTSALACALLALLLYRGQVQWWFYGLARVLEHNRGGHMSYLLGEWSGQGWWYYFIVALAVKTPVPLLGLALVGGVAVLRGLRGGKTYEQLVLVLPGVIWLGIAMTSRINIGIRHILPAYAFLLVLAAAGAGQLLSRRWSALLLAALLCWQAAGALRTYPDYIPYFNEPAGGPGAGIRYFADSNCDWGQEMLTLRDYMREHGTPSAAVYSLASPAPDIYGIQVISQLEPPTPDHPALLAVGARDYAQIMFMGTEEYRRSREFLQRQDMLVRLGNSLPVFRVTEPFPRPFP